MSPRDPQCAKLQEAIALASSIAHCPTDEHTRRATIMFCLERTIEGFPVSRSFTCGTRSFADHSLRLTSFRTRGTLLTLSTSRTFHRNALCIADP